MGQFPERRGKSLIRPDIDTAMALIGALRLARTGMLARLRQHKGLAVDDAHMADLLTGLEAQGMALEWAEGQLGGLDDLTQLNRALMMMLQDIRDTNTDDVMRDAAKLGLVLTQIDGVLPASR